MSNPLCTMSDVARRAGVHPATVSRALRDDPRISVAQRNKVKRIAKKLGYRANPLVAALMSARGARRGSDYRATLACITKYPPERTAGFQRDFGQLIAGARQRAVSHGYTLEEFNVQSLSPKRATEILLNRNVHGLLIAPLHSVQDPVVLDWSHFSTIAIGYSLSDVAASRVAHNHFSALLLATQQCRAAGWRRMGLVLQQRLHEKVEKRWLAAFLLDQSEHPAADRVPPLLVDDWNEPEFSAWFLRYRPEVVLTVNVPRIIVFLKHLGLQVPEEVCVVNLDRRSTDRGVAGINQDYVSWGATAVDLLVGMVHRNERGLPVKPLKMLSDGEWVPGATLRKRESALSAKGRAVLDSSGTS